MIFPQKRFQPPIYSDVAMLKLLIIVTYAGSRDSFIQTDPQYFIATRYFKTMIERYFNTVEGCAAAQGHSNF